MYYKLKNLRLFPVFAVAIFFGVISYCVSIIELCLYYFFEPFDVNQQSKIIPSKGRKILHVVVYVCLFSCLGFWFAYITLVLVWMVLGAVLEPEFYLPYATAAGSIILFAVAKGSQFHTEFQATKSAVTRAIR